MSIAMSISTTFKIMESIPVEFKDEELEGKFPIDLEGMNPEELTQLIDGEPLPVGASSSTAASAIGDSTVEEIASRIEKDATPFHCDKEYSPAYAPKREQPHHRVICYLLAQGHTPGEVAEKTGFTRVTITYIKNQPWAQKQIAEYIKEAGEASVREVFKLAAVPAAKWLADVASGKIECDHKLRATEANKLLDRLYGTAPQVVRQETKSVDSCSNEELMAIINSGGSN